MRRFACIWAFALLGLFCVSPCSGQQTGVVKVAIESKWHGWGEHHTEIVIARDDHGYQNNDRRVDARLVESLTQALGEPVIANPDLQNLGINQAWLDANASAAAEKFAVNVDRNADSLNEKALYQASFTNIDLVRKVIPNLFSFVKFDDYPSAEVDLTFDNGSTISVFSSSWYLYMLPWKVKRNGEEVVTYNANISRAIGALMPTESTNRSRIEGQGLAANVGEAVMQQIEKDWKLLNIENRVGATFTTLRATYNIESAEINSYSTVAYGVAWKGHRKHEQNLNLVLKQASFPPGFSENAILPYKGGRVYGTDDFLQSAGRYEELVLSVPWLKGLLETSPEYNLELLWVHDASFSVKALDLFSADMKALGKGALVDEVRSERHKIAVITVHYGDYWLVLPDKRMVLWRRSSVSGLLGLNPSDFTFQKCTDYKTVTGGCFGIVVLPDGTIAR